MKLQHTTSTLLSYVLVLVIVLISCFSVSASESCCKFKLQQTEAEPQWIQDPNAIAPPSWQGETQWIDDPDDVKPEGWDDEDDGDWAPIRILNPSYAWEPPQILNPNYVPPSTFWEKFEVEVRAAFPWVNVGVLFTGLLSSIPLPLDVFQKWLHPVQSGSTFWQWFTQIRTLVVASLFGLAVPLCSCGALPLCVGLMSQGIPLSTAMAFLTASQSAGLDSAAITYGLLGVQAMIGRLVCAILLGLSVGLVCPGQPSGTVLAKKTCNPTAAHPPSLRSLFNALLSTSVEIYPTVLLGLALSTAALHFLPNLLRYDHHANTAYLLLTKLTVVGSAIPLQLCEHTAVTLASAIQRAGGSPGLAFGFLPPTCPAFYSYGTTQALYLLRSVS
eukprot:Nitzschia sp. Nitz4//scaffold29_size155292//109839//111012//NITZ4_002676-RA/size155292-processed-gene-0.294-mRNA-1//-1//CDS//3329546502//9068//frame0